MLKRFTFILFLFSSLLTYAQTTQSIPGPIIVCPAGEFDGHHHTPADHWIAEAVQSHASQSLAGGSSCANIQVNYVGFTPEAEAAFQAAVDIWESILSSPITIVVDANWTVLGEGVLGSAGPSNLFTSFPNAPDDSYYASALADKIAGEDLDPGFSDITSNFNSDFDWYLGTDGNTPNDQYDLISVVLHELGHGLGFLSSKDYDEGSGVGSLGLGFGSDPIIYDHFLTLGDGGTDLLDITNNSVALGNAFTSDNVFSSSPLAIAANGGNSPQMYAPDEYAGGSSISHWNESTFTAGDPQSLMTPQIGAGEAIHNPGSITLGLFEDMGWTICGSVTPDCGIESLELDGPESICPGEITTVEVNSPALVPVGGGIAIEFLNVATQEAINLTGVDLPYSFDNDLNGVLSFNGLDPFEGEFELTAFVYEDVEDLENTTCATGASPVTVYFLTSSDPACSGGGCTVGNLLLDGPSDICPGETTTVELNTTPDIPTGGGLGILFQNTATLEGINLTGVVLPYTFDNDLNGLLSANAFDPFEGEYELSAFVYEDVSDLEGTTCAQSAMPVIVNFLDENDPACNGTDNCSIDPLQLDGPDSICPAEITTVEVNTAAEVPTGGGIAIQFLNVATQEAIDLTGVDLPYSFDNDLNGVLSFNGLDPFEGEFELTAFVYSDANDYSGTICATGTSSVTVFFLTENDPACNGTDNCSIDPLQLDGPDSICPAEITTVEVNTAAEVPTGGGIAIQFLNVATQEAIDLTGVDLPYSFDNDLNGVLSFNGLDPFEGEFELTAFVYSDANDYSGTICATGTSSVTVFFLTENDPACGGSGGCAIGPLVLDGPDSICPTEVTTVELSSPAEVPTDGGIGIEMMNVTTSDIINLTDVALPYTFDNDLNGVLSANSIDPFVGEYEFVAFVYDDSNEPLNSICATASSAVTIYFLDENDPICNPNDPCESGDISAPDGNELCPIDTKVIANNGAYEIPSMGGYRLVATSGADEYIIPIDNPGADYTVDNDLGGIVSGAGDGPLLGNVVFVAQTFSDASDPENTICAESDELLFIFHEESSTFCTNSVEDLNNADSWSLYPNPAQNEINIKLNATGISEVNISIYDISGRLVYEESNRQLEGGNLKVNIANLNQGAYQVMLSNQDFKSTKPLLITK